MSNHIKPLSLKIEYTININNRAAMEMKISIKRCNHHSKKHKNRKALKNSIRISQIFCQIF